MKENNTKYIFNYNLTTRGIIRVSVMKLGLIFNDKTIRALGFPKKINIGLDANNKVLSIKSSDGDKNIPEFDFVKKGDEKWIRVSCRPVVRAIEEITKVKYTDKMQSYPAYFDEELNMLTVNLN